MGKITTFEMVQLVLYSARFYFLQCCIDLIKTKQRVEQFLLILYYKNPKKTVFWFLCPRWWKSKNTAYKCINLTLRGAKDNPGILQHPLTFDQRNMNYWPKFRRGYFRIPDFYSAPYKQKLSYRQFITSDDIDMKLEPGTKLNKENSDDEVICDAIVTFAMYC